MSFGSFVTLAKMHKETREMSKKSLEKSKMSELVFASQMMRERIAPPSRAGSKGERIRAASFDLGWKYSRAESVWYADERVSLKPRELRKIEEKSGVTYAEFIADGRKEVRTNDELIARAESLLAGTDEDFHRPFIAAMRAFFGALDRTGTEG